MPVDPTRLVTLRGLEATFQDQDGSPLFPENTVRGWIHADLDRFKSLCVVKPGGKVLIDLDAFAAWLEERRGAPGDALVSRHRRSKRRREDSGELHPIRRALLEGRRALSTPG